MTIQPHTIAICEAHYNGGAGCGRCPIHEACHSSPSKLSAESLSAWYARCDQAAAEIGGE